MNKIERIKELTEELLRYCHEYYVLDKPSISDFEYDKKFDTLKKLEDENNFWLANSPTRKVQGEVLDGFNKITHSKPMLSAAKTKDINEIKRFVGNNDFYCSYKLDGLTLVCSWKNGEFKQAVTRGTGIIGEDVTEQAKMISNLPLKIPYTEYLELRGECVISWDNFEQLKEKYSHPRNAAAGGLRNLDTNITKQRNLSYVVFECVHGIDDDHKLSQLDKLAHMGFEVVDFCGANVERCVEIMPPDTYKYPVDGLIFELSSNSLSKSLESTSHHEGCRMALKWADNTYETILRDVIWDVGRSGVISPVAVFDEVDLDGALTTKATLHNLSIIEELELGINDTITVYRSNMVIPKVDENLTRSNNLNIPEFCPCCGHMTEIKYTDNSKFLMCTNPDCTAKKVAQFVHFASKNCMNIDGLSEATIEKFIEKGFLNTFKDIYHLDEHRNKLIYLDGFGVKSIDKLLSAINKSRNVKLENFIAALGIPNIGLSASKIISKTFDGDVYAFLNAAIFGYDFTQLEDFGEIMNTSIKEFIINNSVDIQLLVDEMNFIIPEKVEVKENTFTGKNICVTGKLHHFTRNSINEKILSLGAKAASSVSTKTDYLITNEQSGSSKYKKAIELNIPIITEDEFLEMLGE